MTGKYAYAGSLQEAVVRSVLAATKRTGVVRDGLYAINGGRFRPGLSSQTHNLNPQPVVVEIAEAVSLPLQDLHLCVETFGDAVIAGKAPHGGDLQGPRMQGFAELHQLRQAGLGWQDTRYLRFDINSNHGGGSCGSCLTMAEVQFADEAGEEMPEPGTLVLAAVGSAALLWWRRCSR